ncbi:hypothetical protein [Agrococcus sp. KRD186]|uniref:hypothetical protein n=1 Tax=Agrococcus sp. KRD186 TaxID=2729730 RepID=UPI0019D23A5D|nr:hypothetical protein [Agrococcus sp. KRD186]
MTDSSQPVTGREAYLGGAAPDSGGAPLGDAYGTDPAMPGSAMPGSAMAETDMPRTVPGSSWPEADPSRQGTAETVKDEAQHVGESAKDAGKHIADTAKDEARQVAGEAKQQARQLLDQTMHEAREQARSQQHRAADGMHTFGDDLRGMADGAQSGLAAQLVSEVGERASAAARWLEEREPADVLDEVKAFARRRPGTFIAIAGVAGLLVGRLARSIMSEANDEREQRDRSASGPAVDADVPAQTGHSPSGTGMPSGRREAGL